jgi:hypothetical protein
MAQGTRSMTFHSTAVRISPLKTVSPLFTVLVGRDHRQRFVAKGRNEMQSQGRFLRRNAARFESVQPVSEEGNAGSGGGGGSGVSDGIGINPAGFPPRATYRFESGPLAGLTVLSTGPRVVYYSRTVSYGWQFAVSEVDIGGPTGAERLRYVQAYVFPEREPQDFVRQIGERNESARWEGDDALRRRVDDLRVDMLQKYRDFLATLIARGRLTAADSQSLAQPPIDVRIVDARKDTSRPLPAIK